MLNRDPINYFVHWHKSDKPCSLVGGNIRVFPDDKKLEERVKCCSSLKDAEALYDDLSENCYVMGVQILAPVKSSMYTAVTKLDALGDSLVFYKEKGK